MINSENMTIDGWEDEEYLSFVEKYKTKKTTDDCYTPAPVYDAIAAWVSKEYGIEQSRFVRPFYPGGDFERFDYAEDAVVVDNPPFSILTKIVSFYLNREIPFFLFAPALTLFSNAARCSSAAYIVCGVQITYENGAKVPTSFITNLGDGTIRVRTAPDLYDAVQKANDASKNVKLLPRYEYPDQIITAAMVQRWGKFGVDYKLTREDSLPIAALDAQKCRDVTIFGGGFILSSRAAAERAAAERAAAERAAVEKWQLSDREWAIVRYIDERKERKTKDAEG